MNDKCFRIMENNVLKEYEVYKLCKNESTGKRYIIYKDDNNLYASLINYSHGKFILDQIRDDSEWDFLDMEIGKDE